MKKRVQWSLADAGELIRQSRAQLCSPKSNYNPNPDHILTLNLIFTLTQALNLVIL